MSIRIAAFDPGVTGSCAFYDGERVYVHDYPTYSVERKTKKLGVPVNTKRTHYSIEKLAELIEGLDPDIAIIEEVSARPTDGVIQAFSFGKGYGLLLGMLAMLNDEGVPTCKVTGVRPAVWKKAIGLPTGSTKNDSRLMAISLFPELTEDLKLKKNEGRAEAALLIYYYLNHRKT